jgi:di/tricarboxylate transporter
MAIWGVTAILLTAPVLLATEKISVDRPAIGLMVALMAGGILTPGEAIAGFSNPAVITVAALFIPIVFSLSCEYDFSPSKILIPMSYVSILAGTCTLIGTPTNIIISDLSDKHGYGKTEMGKKRRLSSVTALAQGQPVCFMRRT